MGSGLSRALRFPVANKTKCKRAATSYLKEVNLAYCRWKKDVIGMEKGPERSRDDKRKRLKYSSDIS